MSYQNEVESNRRKLLKYLALSPLLSSSHGLADSLQENGSTELGLSDQEINEHLLSLINSPEEAINVFDFEEVAKSKLPLAHYGYLAGGVESDATLHENREAFSRLYLRPKRLRDVSAIDMSTELFGETWSSPFVIAPAGSQKAFHADGEIAVAKAARKHSHLQILSTVSTSSIESVSAARSAPVWFQLYPTASWSTALSMIRRAEQSECPVLVLTVDLPTVTNRETEKRYRRLDSRDCSACHTPTIEGALERKPMFDEANKSELTGLTFPSMTWEFVDKLRSTTSMKIVLKGIVTREDAKESLKHGVDGIIVSNHGGRAEESGRATIDSLPEVVDAIDGKIPVLMDSGIRRGSDAFKAIALGADAVCIGRPYLWGLAAFGQPGVEAVLSMLREELKGVMMFSGTRSLKEIKPSFVAKK